MTAREREIAILRDLIHQTLWNFRRPDADPVAVAKKLERALSGT
ncbi:MAG: hypothetical protein NVS3B12_08680 [Acidimicrobiales bacterium]